jgi:hypothetical protein
MPGWFGHIGFHEYRILNSNEWLTAQIVNFQMARIGASYIGSLWDEDDSLYVLQSYAWYGVDNDKENDEDSQCIPSEFKYEHCKYIAVPMCINKNHWVLAIIAHLATLHLPQPRTMIFYFNSMSSSGPSIPNTIAQKLGTLAITLLQRSSLATATAHCQPDDIPVRAVRVPQQTNYRDCGLFPPHFLNVFLSDPPLYESYCRGEYNFEDYGQSLESFWMCFAPDQFRSDLRIAVESLSKFRSEMARICPRP